MSDLTMPDYKEIPDLGEPNDLTELPTRSEPLVSEYPPDAPEPECPYCGSTNLSLIGMGEMVFAECYECGHRIAEQDRP